MHKTINQTSAIQGLNDSARSIYSEAKTTLPIWGQVKSHEARSNV
jgi:hypothetical protein